MIEYTIISLNHAIMHVYERIVLKWTMRNIFVKKAQQVEKMFVKLMICFQRNHQVTSRICKILSE